MPIDDKIVAMSFESSKFESGVSSTLSAIEKLKAALNFGHVGKGFGDIDMASKRVDLSHIGRGVDEIKSKLESLKLVAIGVFAQLATQAIRVGGTFLKSFTIAPLKQGFQEYSTQLNSVQTILANTQAAGATLKDVNATLNELNTYSDKTIYNFGQMAKNIGTFTAAGVDLKTATASIKGIANLAALSGSNADQAATAMYQLSQAISSGSVKLMDWNSVVNAGMGGTVFQRALAQTAEHMGALKKGTVELVGPMKNVKIAGESFRNSLSAPGKDGWLTSKVLTETLKMFTSDMTDAELAAKGWDKAQIKAIQQQAKTAMLAATTVKTLSQALDVAKETAGSGWAKTWQIIFGDFAEAKTTFTALSNAINGVLIDSARARNNVLGDWKALGGRTVLIAAISNAWHNLGLILKPIKAAFHDIFPATTGQTLQDLTVKFWIFTNALKPGKEMAENLRRTFRGFFAVLDIGKQIIGGVFTMLGKMFGAVGEGSSSFLNFTGSVGDFLVSVDQALKKGGALTKFFESLGNVLGAPIKLLASLAGALSKAFGGFSAGGFSSQLGLMSKGIGSFTKMLDGLGGTWDKFTSSFGGGGGGDSMQKSMDGFVKMITGLGTAMGKAAAGINWESVFAAIRTGLFAGLVLMLKQFLGKGSFLDQLGKGLGGRGGIIGNIAGSFNALEGSMKSLQTNIKAKTLKEIAIAVALLAASVLVISLIDPGRLKASLGAMAAMFGELVGAMAVLSTVTKTAGFIKLPIITASLILLAGAIDLLSIAVLLLSMLSWEQLLRGLTGVGVLLGIVVAASIPLSANSAGMIRAGIGITAMAIGLNLLAIAVLIFSSMSWGEMVKGLTGVAGGLVVLAGAMRLMPSSMVLTGGGLILMASGLFILAQAVKQFGNMDWRTMGTGLAGIGGSLVVIALALHLMPKGLIFIAAGLLGVTGALAGIAKVVQSFGGMSAKEMAKGLIGLAASLGILAGALYLMSGVSAGAFALGIAATGLALLTPSIMALGKMSWGSIVKGLVVLAASLAIIGIAGALLTPVIPALLGFGVALVLIGGGLALAGAGIALIGIGLSAIAIAGPTAVDILIGALIQLSQELPRFVTNVVNALLAMVDQLAQTAPLFATALVKIVSSLVDVIIQATPKIALGFLALLAMAIKVIKEQTPKLIQAGIGLILALLTGIKNNIGKVTTTVVDIIVKFIGALTSNVGKIVTAGVSLLVALIKGIVSAQPKIIIAVLDIIAKFLNAIANNIGKIVTAGMNILIKFLQGISNNINRVIKLGADIIVKFIVGIGNAGSRVIKAGTDTIIKLINALGSAGVKLTNAGFKALIKFINGITNAINQNMPLLRTAALGLAGAIINGLTFGLAGRAHEVYNKVTEIMGKAMSIMHKIPGVKSPSTVTFAIGEEIIHGLTNGLTATAPKVFAAADEIAKAVLKKFNDIFFVGSTNVMTSLGEFVSRGFAEGLLGSTDDVIGAFSELNTKILEAMKTSKDNIVEAQKAQKEILASDKPDVKAFLAQQKIIEQNEAVLKKSTAAHKLLVTQLKADGEALLKVTMEYDAVTEQLNKAEEKLKEAQQTQLDAIESFKQQYDALPSIAETGAEAIASARESIAAEQKKLDELLADSESSIEDIAAARKSLAEEQGKLDKSLEGKVLDVTGTQVDLVATYLLGLKTQADSVSAYNATLEQLRGLGIDKETYDKLVKEGPADQAFANQLLAGGQTAVDSLNVLDAQLATVSKTLAINAAKNLTQAGIDGAQGIVDGFRSQQGELYAEMTRIGNKMVEAMRKAIKSHSPSQRFAEIGKFSMQGLAQGFTNSSKIVTDAVDTAAQDALAAMKKSMSKVSDIVTDELNPNPVITPILDLTQVRKQIPALDALTNVAASSFGQASIISSSQTSAQEEEAIAASGGTSVKFEQNNYSPKALTEIEIYRQTRNQLSQLKSVLTT